MPTKLTTEQFIEKSNVIHNNKYDYSNTIYLSSNDVVTIICPKHGKFEKLAKKHLLGQGCQQCSLENKKDNLEIFIEKANAVHSHKYDYSESTYVRSKDQITIKCNIHGKFTLRTSDHLQGIGCPQCKLNTNIEHIKNNFIEKSNIIHNNKYNYDNVNYINNNTKVTIVCPTHGDFEQTPSNHLQGKGCSKCVINISKQELEICEYLDLLNIQYIQSYRPKFLNGQELDIFIPDYNLAIEYNGTHYHHSSSTSLIKFFQCTSKPKDYHFNKWLSCRENGIVLLSIYDFYWKNNTKKDILKSKIKHYLQLDKKIYARKCIIKEISNVQAKEFYQENHIEGSGMLYKESKSYGLYYNETLYMCVTIGKFYDQSNKNFKYKVQRICTLKDYTVVGGISKLNKFLLTLYPKYSYQITLSSGGTSLIATNKYNILNPRYFWVNPKTLEYFHRNYCQKHLLEKHFKIPLLDNDTETSYMEKLGYLKVYDNGLAELYFNKET